MTNPCRHTPAFTLLELLVVISLMVGVLSIGLLFYSTGTLTANGLNGATNQVSSALASARALALQNAKDAAVIFSYDPNDDCVHLRVVEYNGTIDPTYGMIFQDINDQPPERLPNQVMVRIPVFSTLSGSPVNWLGPLGVLNPTNPNPGITWATTPTPSPTQQLYQGVSPGTSSTLLAVWFGPDGATRTSTPTGNSLIAYLPANGSGTDLAATPATVLLLYDNRDILNAQYADVSGNQNLGGWLTSQTSSGGIVNPWDAAATYEPGDEASYNNTNWVSSATSTGQAPFTGSAYWGVDSRISPIRLLTFNRYSGILVRKQH